LSFELDCCPAERGNLYDAICRERVERSVKD
jgi:hypothetical protein